MLSRKFMVLLLSIMLVAILAVAGIYSDQPQGEQLVVDDVPEEEVGEAVVEEEVGETVVEEVPDFENIPIEERFTEKELDVIEEQMGVTLNDEGEISMPLDMIASDGSSTSIKWAEVVEDDLGESEDIVDAKEEPVQRDDGFEFSEEAVEVENEDGSKVLIEVVVEDDSDQESVTEENPLLAEIRDGELLDIEEYIFSEDLRSVIAEYGSLGSDESSYIGDLDNEYLSYHFDDSSFAEMSTVVLKDLEAYKGDMKNAEAGMVCAINSMAKIRNYELKGEEYQIFVLGLSEWADNSHDLTFLSVPFTGIVVDSSGNVVKGADKEVIFTTVFVTIRVAGEAVHVSTEANQAQDYSAAVEEAVFIESLLSAGVIDSSSIRKSGSVDPKEVKISVLDGKYYMNAYLTYENGKVVLDVYDEKLE